MVNGDVVFPGTRSEHVSGVEVVMVRRGGEGTASNGLRCTSRANVGEAFKEISLPFILWFG